MRDVQRLFREYELFLSRHRTIELVYEEMINGQYLMIEARPANGARGSVSPLPAEEEPAEIGALVRGFTSSIADKLDRLRAQLDGWAAAGKRVVLWGSGSILKCIR